MNKKNFQFYYSQFLKSTLKKIETTIIGVKPAELRNIRAHNGNQKLWRLSKRKLLEIAELRIKEVYQEDKSIKVFFYHKKALKKQLEKAQVQSFLKKLNYPANYNLKDYVDYLIERLKGYYLNKKEFPHEIGLFFAYPLKDVQGYMGYNNLDYKCIREWKIYGKENISLIKLKKYQRARKMFKKKIDNMDTLNIDQLLKKID